ncbi:MAG TPA: 1,4-dihydroxy-2-naphthoate polyprenyltransferase [Anaerolineales bacterium]|nr:1,4-dihydroxy-2-naphthoate polyprenyltransferase [Anaerolineales bacterium]
MALPSYINLVGLTVNPENSHPNRFQIWWLAIRPRTLPAAAAGVVAGCALTLHEQVFRPLPALAALAVALLLQIGSNLANDVFDYERGADSARSHGPLRVTQSGLLRPAQVKAGMICVFVLAGLIGLYLAFVAGWIVLLIGLTAILSAIAYTGGPFPLGYYGLGDLFVFLFFGLACVAGTYFVQAGRVSPAAWAMSLPVGLIVVGILVVNNLRDLATDEQAGKHTLAVLLGERFAKGEYLACLLVAFLCLPVFCALGMLPWTALLAWLALPLAVRLTRIVFTQTGRALNAALGGTGQLAFAFSLLFLIGMLLAR